MDKPKEITWDYIIKFLNSRNIEEINFKNMTVLKNATISNITLDSSNVPKITLVSIMKYDLNDLDTTRAKDLFSVLKAYVKNPNADSAIFQTYIESVKRTGKAQKVLNAWLGKK